MNQTRALLFSEKAITDIQQTRRIYSVCLDCADGGGRRERRGTEKENGRGRNCRAARLVLGGHVDRWGECQLQSWKELRSEDACSTVIVAVWTTAVRQEGQLGLH